MKILIIDGDKRIVNILAVALSEVAEVEIARNREAAKLMVDKSYYDLIVMDIILEDTYGLDLLRDLRAVRLIPIMILTAINELDIKVECLNIGADDYMTKPFVKEELIARTRAILRRSGSSFSAIRYEYENIEVNYVNKMFIIDGKYVEMNRKTYEILELLVRNKNLIMTKQIIFDRIWGYYSSTVQTVVEINIFKLRKTLGEYGLAKHLKTVKSTGYMWVENIHE